jgi:hypothetical protein
MPAGQFLCNLQTRGALIAAFTSKIRWMTKSFFRHWLLVQYFFIAYLQIIVRCNTKGTVGAVCVLLRIWPLSNYQLLYEMAQNL